MDELRKKKSIDYKMKEGRAYHVLLLLKCYKRARIDPSKLTLYFFYF